MQEYPNDIMHAQVDESWLGKTRQRGIWFGYPTIVFGLITDSGKVYLRLTFNTVTHLGAMGQI